MLLSMASPVSARGAASSDSSSSSSSSDAAAACRIPRSRRKQAKKPLKEDPHLPDIEDLTLRFAPEEGLAIRSALLDWYSVHQRDLPWRRICHRNVRSAAEADAADGDEQGEGAETKRQQARAYATWVSEVMLQQTRVATVVEYFDRWMSTWPTIKDLASASQEEVNTVWAGLGYYRRARFLLEGAKQIVGSEQGLLPSTAEELLKIRGIGKYTAGAISSIAFGQPVPVVDGNVIRVLSRVKAISDNPKELSTIKTIWSLAEQLVDKERPGDLNQALMELGAMICLPTSPQCSSCPIRKHCRAFALSQDSAPQILVTDFPMKVAKSAPRLEYVAVCVLECRSTSFVEPAKSVASSKFLLVKRPKTGLLAGLWEFPSANLGCPNASNSRCQTAIDNYLKSKLDLRIGEGWLVFQERKALGSVVHIFSHIRMHIAVEWMCINSTEPDDSPLAEEIQVNGINARWIPATEMLNIGLTTGVKKVYKMFLNFHKDRLSAGWKVKRKRNKR